jgi:hypothetical protein
VKPLLLTVDPGLYSAGWALLDGYTVDVWQYRDKRRGPHAALRLMRDVMQRHLPRNVPLVLEKPIPPGPPGARKKDTVVTVAMTAGVILGVVTVPAFILTTPQSWNHQGTGLARAAVWALAGHHDELMQPGNADALSALGIMLWHLNKTGQPFPSRLGGVHAIGPEEADGQQEEEA